MTYRGHIQNGAAVLSAPVELPDGTPVVVEIERADSPFWQERTIEELAAEQKVEPVKSLDELAGDWPEEDSIDDFLAFVRKVRA